ncbi:MAG: type IV toxin-antitoxin system AbiEi family antitoxin domain-containing protein [Clostridia bacterium]
MDNIDKIKKMVEKNNGILLVTDLEKSNIHRQYLKQLEEIGYLKKVSRGIYLKKGKEVNEFFIMGEKYKKGIFSHNTALYFYDLTDRTPIKLDMTFPSYITVHNDSIKTHYIKEEYHLLGAEEMQLDDGTTIRVYNMERTICDIIRDRNKMDPQIFNIAMKEYSKRKNKNLNLLYKYAKKFRIENKLKQYMEVLD